MHIIWYKNERLLCVCRRQVCLGPAGALFHQLVASCLGSHCSNRKAFWLPLPAQTSGICSSPLEAFCGRVLLQT